MCRFFFFLKLFLFLNVTHQARLYGKSVADTHLEGRICHAFCVFPWKMFTELLLCKSKLLHQGLWRWIMAAEVAVDHSLILCTTLLQDVCTE